MQIAFDRVARRYSRYSAACPHCKFSWRLPEDVESGVASPPRSFAVAIKEIRIRFGADVIGFKILLEFDEPGNERY